MRNLLGDMMMGVLIGVLAAVAFGLLIAAAVVAFAELVGVGGALGIVGGGLVMLAMLLAYLIQVRQRQRAAHRRESTVDIGGIAAGFLLGVWDGLSKPRRRD